MSSVEYQSTRIVPSAVLVGAMAMDFVRSAAIPCSTSKRSRVYGAVEVRVNSRLTAEPLVWVRTASSLPPVLMDSRRKGVGSCVSTFSSSSTSFCAFFSLDSLSLSEAGLS